MKYYLWIVTFFLIIALCFMSCEERVSYDLSPMRVTIEHSSGDNYDTTEGSFLPFPANGTNVDHNGESIETYIISKTIEPGINIGILPFKEVHFKDSNGTVSKIILAFPSDESLVLSNNETERLNGDKLYAAIHIIEYWYTHRDGLNGKHKIQERSVSYEDYIN